MCSAWARPDCRNCLPNASPLTKVNIPNWIRMRTFEFMVEPKASQYAETLGKPVSESSLLVPLVLPALLARTAMVGGKKI